MNANIVALNSCKRKNGTEIFEPLREPVDLAVH